MIKVFTTNERGNIELPKDELEYLLREAYDEGRKMSGIYERPSIDEVSSPVTINPLPHITWTANSPLNNFNTITATNATQAINFPQGDQ